MIFLGGGLNDTTPSPVDTPLALNIKVRASTYDLYLTAKDKLYSRFKLYRTNNLTNNNLTEY